MVLPWVPEMAIMRRSSSAEASAAARRRNGLPLLRAATNSGCAGADRRRVDERVGRVDVLWRVTDLDVGAERPQRRHGGRIARLAAADRDAALDQDAGQRAHPGPGDAHDVHPAQRGQGRDHVGRRRCAPAPRRAPPSRPVDHDQRPGSVPRGGRRLPRALAHRTVPNRRCSAATFSTARARTTSASRDPAPAADRDMAASRHGSVMSGIRFSTIQPGLQRRRPRRAGRRRPGRSVGR